MNALSKNISTIAAVRTQRFVIDFLEIHTLLSFAIAFCAGYFFQAKWVYNLIGDTTAARTIAAITCVGLTALVKYLMRCLDDNETLGPVIHKWIKPVFGIVAVVVIFWIDSKTSNMAIENSRADAVANQIASNADDSHIAELKRSKTYQENQVAYFNQLEAATGKKYITKREIALKEIGRLDQLMSRAESDRRAAIGKANDLRMATVKDSSTDSLKDVRYGTFVLLIAIAIEVLAIGRRRPSRFYEIELENLSPLVEVRQPIALLPARTETAMATVSTRETEEALIHRKTETVTEHKIPVETKPVKIEPTSWEDACILIVTGKVRLSERQVIKMFPGISRHKVRAKLDNLRHSPSLLADGRN